MHPPSKPPGTIPPTAGGGIARLAMARAVAAGIDPAPALHAAGLTAKEIEDPGTRLSVQSQVTLLNLLADALHDDMLGFHLAERFELREIGLFYYVLASSATLGEAFARIERYSGVTNEGIKTLCRQADDLRVGYSYVGVPRHADRHQIEFWVTAFVRICRCLTDTSLRPTRVGLAHPPCGSSGELNAFFGCKVAFGAESDEIAFALSASHLPLIGADPYLNELLVRICDEILARRGNPVLRMRTVVENKIAPLLPHGKAHITEIAQTLGMSRRTLARRLAAEGTTFTEILEDLRKDLALRYLEDATLSVSQIAWLLGFQEVSAFTGAFRRWTGTTPTQARIRLATVSADAGS